MRESIVRILGLLCGAAVVLCSAGACDNLLGGQGGTLGPEDVPEGAQRITTFNGEWLSQEFAYAFEIANRIGVVTLPSSSATRVGDIVLVITFVDGNKFNGRQIFSNGSIQDVIGQLVDPDTLSMVGGGLSWSMTRISSPNLPPQVSAGEDQTISPEVGQAELDGTVTDDDKPDDIVATEWSKVSGPEGVEFDDPGAVDTTVTFTQAGVYVLQLEADDGDLTASATVTITVNTPPTADAGQDQDVTPGEEVTLDGTGSSDPDDDDQLRYAWAQTDGPQVELSSRTDAAPLFTAPDAPTSLTFELAVNDSRGAIATDTVTVTVNSPPLADAGRDRTVNPGQEVTLDGSGSSDPDLEDALAYSWAQIDGAEVTLSSATVAQPKFTAPESPTVLTFELTVTDSQGASDVDTVTITVTEAPNAPPSAHAGEDRNVVAGLAVTLDGLASSDPEGDPLSFSWEQTDGVDVELSDPDSPQPTFTVPEGAEVLSFMLTVDDGREGVDTASVTLTVLSEPRVRLSTSMGDVLVEILLDETPITSVNFLQYVEDGFYNGTIFHRIVPDFVVQGGGFLPGMVAQEDVRDPILNEFDPERSNVRGTVAMAKVGNDPDSATSQFFFNLADNSENLDNQNGGFTVFARVLEGMDVVDAMAEVELDGETPLEDVLLTTATIE